MQADALPTDQQSGYLGVSLSASGKRWEARADEPRLTAALAQRFDLPEPVARSLAARGIGLEGAEAFLDPKLSRDLPDPMHCWIWTRRPAGLPMRSRRGSWSLSLAIMMSMARHHQHC